MILKNIWFEMKIPKEIVFEIYNHLGNTDKRRLRQTSTQYDIKFKEKNVLEELIEDGYDIPEKYDRYYRDCFVRYGRLDLLQRSKPKIDNLCCMAAGYGQLEILKWAHENNYAWGVWTSRTAAQEHLACLKYAHENGCPWDTWTSAYAANGHLECLKYAHENGCRWGEDTCRAAAQGHLECLKYAHEHGCPWNKYTYDNAYKHLDCLIYLNEHGCPKT